jgi:hypothetical protein
MIIQTVYRPEQDIKYIEDWLNHHTAIGVTNFYLYDNGGSIGDEKEYSNLFVSKISKYKYPVDQSKLDEYREKERIIFKRYPVTKILWQPKNKNNQIIYDQVGALKHFSSIVDKGLCAFIDMDEFIIAKEEFFESRLFQKKFKHISEYKSVYDCHDACDLNTSNMDTKVILNMSKFKKYLSYNNKEVTIHFNFLDHLPKTKNYYNHYNHNAYSHKLLFKYGKGWTGEFKKEYLKYAKPYNDVFYKEYDTGLKKYY